MDDTPRLNYGFYKVGAPVSRRDVFVFVYSQADKETFALANALQKEFQTRNLRCEAWAADTSTNYRNLKSQGITIDEVPCVVYRDFDGTPNILTTPTTSAAVADWVKELRVASAVRMVKSME